MITVPTKFYVMSTCSLLNESQHPPHSFLPAHIFKHNGIENGNHYFVHFTPFQACQVS